LAVALAGCSKNSLAPAKISGSVTYNGQSVKAGSIAFHTPEGIVYGTTINPDGTYSITDVPTGELVVTVETESLNPAGKKDGGPATPQAGAYKKASSTQEPPPGVVAAGPPPAPEYTKIPAKYAKPNTSPLTVTIKGGRNVQNIEMTD